MTRALHELLDGSHERIDDPELLNQLNEEFHNTVQELRAPTADPETLHDVEEAGERLKRGLGALGLHELYALMDAAAASRDARVDSLAREAIKARFPTEGTGHKAYEEANFRSQREWMKGLDMAQESNGAKPFSNALVEASTLTDEALHNSFDEVIDESNLSVREQRSARGEKGYEKLTPKEQQDLDHYREERRRRQERQKLEAIGELDDETYDDAVKFDPFADDDEDDERAA